MAEPTDLEKKSLEAHVDLCAQRYRFLESRLEDVGAKISAVETMVKQVHDMIDSISQRRNDQLINWGLGLIGGLLAIIGYLLTVYVI